MKKVLKWFRKHNEFTFVIGLIFLIWFVAPPLLRMYDPQAGSFGVEMLYIPLLGVVFFFIEIIFLWLYLKLVYPKGFRILDNLFENADYYEKWESSKLLLRLFGWLVVLLSVNVLAVSGVSAII